MARWREGEGQYSNDEKYHINTSTSWNRNWTTSTPTQLPSASQRLCQHKNDGRMGEVGTGEGGQEVGGGKGCSCNFSQKWVAPVSVSAPWNAMLCPQASHGVGGAALRGQPFALGFLLAAANRWASVSIQSEGKRHTFSGYFRLLAS